MEEIEKNIKKRLIELDITQGDLAEKLGVKRQWLNKAINRGDFKVSFLMQLCGALNCKANDLLY